MTRMRWVQARTFAAALIAVTLGNGAFAATISGTVTTPGGSPIPDGLVRIYSSAGSSLGIAFLGNDGSYSYSGLAAGTYYARTESTGHFDEQFDGLPCPQRACTPTSGTPILLGSATNGVASFVLEPGGAVRGSVVSTASGLPVSDGLVRIYSSSGTSLGIAFLETDGSYRYGGLAAGTYRARTESTGFFDELWNNLPCAQRNCVPASGNAIAVATNADTTANFNLVDGGAVTGFVTRAGSGAAIADGLVRIYNSSGTSLGIAFMGNDGGYRYSGLAAGTYYARTEDTGANDELWNNIPCAQGNCSPTTGTPITVAAASVSVHFELTSGGAIGGTVTANAGGAPISDGLVRIYDASATSVGIAFLGNDGSYLYSGLAAGTYYTRTESTGYFDELWNGMACPQRNCSPAGGTPIVVGASGTTLANFSLDPGGSIGGSVTDQGGQPVADGLVRIYSQAGASLGITFMDAAGGYHYGGLAAGNYFARTEDTGTDDELWNDIPCPQSVCVPTTGTPITVNANSATVTNFSLGGEAPMYRDGFE